MSHWHAAAIGALMLTAVSGQDSGGPFSGQTLPVSSSVLATFEENKGQLDLLVLWRGAPGWFGSQHQSANYAYGRGFNANLEYGGHPLTIFFDRAGHAQVNGKSVSLPNGANVVLVDNVDQPGGGVVLKVLAIDPRHDPNDKQLSTWFRRDPEMQAFLQCDASKNQYLNRIVCDDLRQK